MTDLLGPLWLSLRIAATATLVVAIVIIPLAFHIARRRAFVGRGLIESLVLLPLVLPPTVVGYLMLLLLGGDGLLTKWMSNWFHYSIVFRFEGAVLAAAIVAVPMMYLPAKAAFASIDRDLEDLARLSGASSLQILVHIFLPIARRGLLAGIVLSFARALGEFGATVMVLGMLPHHMTLPVSIYLDYETGDFSHAGFAVVALSLVSITLIALYNFASGESRRGDRVR